MQSAVEAASLGKYQFCVGSYLGIIMCSVHLYTDLYYPDQYLSESDPIQWTRNRIRI